MKTNCSYAEWFTYNSAQNFDYLFFYTPCIATNLFIASSAGIAFRLAGKKLWRRCLLKPEDFGPTMLSPPSRVYLFVWKLLQNVKSCVSPTPIGYYLFIFKHNSKKYRSRTIIFCCKLLEVWMKHWLFCTYNGWPEFDEIQTEYSRRQVEWLMSKFQLDNVCSCLLGLTRIVDRCYLI
jgi:hypothetical protein